jgi:hypothetical protein
MRDQNIYKELSHKLFDLFFADKSKYGVQLEDSSYRLIRSKISPVTIDKMLLNQGSLLAYQELHAMQYAYIKWICIDLDISKKDIDANDVNPKNLQVVKKACDDVCELLEKLKIPYLVEFSGRRGFHIWVIFDRLQTKLIGFKLISYILSKILLPYNINADRFPKTGFVNKQSKGIGLGVKLPLSQNKASGYQSFFLKDRTVFDFDLENHNVTPDESFFKEQLSILEDYQCVSIEKIQPFLDEFDLANKSNLSPSYIRYRYLEIAQLNVTYESAISALRKCQHIDKILTNYEAGINTQDRRILVGLLGRLTTPDDPEFGINLLMEIFSRVKNFRRDLTIQNLKLAKDYYPVTCSYFGNCNNCSHEKITSPVELIANINVSLNEFFKISNISENLFEKIKSALAKYALINDEIPLYFQLKKLESIEFQTIYDRIDHVMSGKSNRFGESYQFTRNEGNKLRSLYNLDHLDGFVSTYFMFILNTLFYTEISPNSYGYQLTPSFTDGNIFKNWFSNWAKFSNRIEHKIFNEEYQEYYLVKVDIKGFYDRIDLQRLAIKLYEEAPKSIADRLSGLAEEDKSKFKNLVKYLVELSRDTTGDENRGLPQGPAYARYLAELYLLGLDKLIEQEIIKDVSREYYYRFVDDIFIFVEDFQKAQNVLKAIERWVGINGLELNYQKTEIENVKKYGEKGKFKKFKDDAKYLINKANKNKAIISETEVQEALAKLDQITSDVKFGLKDNLRFFYYQFTNDPRLNHVKSKLNRILPFADSGRGTLFMLFYTDLIKNFPLEFWSLADQQEKISGLSLGHFLNTILIHGDLAADNMDKIATLLGSIVERQDLTDAQKSLVVALSLQFNLPIKKEFLNGCSKSTINSIMETPDITYHTSTYDFIISKLEDMDKQAFILELFRIIHDNPLDADVAQKLAKYTFTRFSEWNEDQELTDLLMEPKMMICYYNCLCFFTLFDNSDDENQLIKCWELLLACGEKQSHELDVKFEWLNRVIEHKIEDFSKSSYLILLSNKLGAQLATFNSEYDFIGNFRSILLVLLFAGDRTAEVFTKPGEDFIDDSLFGKWLKDPDVRLYPIADHICLKNLALNGLIILESNETIFIKDVAKSVDLEVFNYLPVANDPHSVEVELTKGTDTAAIYKKFVDFTSFIKAVRLHIDDAELFTSTFKTRLPVYYRVPYKVSQWPLIPFYSSFTQRISAYGVSKENDINSFWEDIDYMIKQNNEALMMIDDDTNPFNFSLEEMGERFYPLSEIIIQSNEDRIKFIKHFSDLLQDHPIETIYDFQYVWSATVNRILEESNSLSAGIIEYLTVHFASFEGNSKPAIDLIFAVNDRTLIEKSNLDQYFGTIRQSFVNFQSEPAINDFSLVQLFDDYVLPFSTLILEKYKLSVGDFVSGTFSYTTGFNVKTSQNETKAKLNDEDIDGRILLLYDNETNRFYSKTILELKNLTQNRDVFVCSCEIEEEGKKSEAVLIYLSDHQLSKSFERIKYRQDIFKTAVKESSEYRNVFPKDSFYQSIEKIYEEFTYQDLEKTLKNHYGTSVNIKDRIVSWLTLINETSIKGSEFEKYLGGKISLDQVRRAILTLLSVHCPIEDSDIKYFKEQLDLVRNDEHLIFAIKHPDRDKNGLFRLLAKCGYPDRDPDFEKNVRLMYSGSKIPDKLVILVDTSISGKQFSKGFKYYTTVLNDAESLLKANQNLVNLKDKYFEFKSIQEQKHFINNLKSIKEVIIITPTITEAFKTNVNGLESLKDKKITFLSNRVVPVESYMYLHNRFNKDQKEIIKHLITDIDLLKTIFKIEDPEKYIEFGTKTEELNTLLRIGSLPTKHIKLLSLSTLSGQKPLLEYIDNWKK